MKYGSMVCMRLCRIFYTINSRTYDHPAVDRMWGFSGNETARISATDLFSNQSSESGPLRAYYYEVFWEGRVKTITRLFQRPDSIYSRMASKPSI